MVDVDLAQRRIRATVPASRDWGALGLYPTTDSAIELARRAASGPERTAVIDAASGTRYDYATLARDVRYLAGSLRELGVRPGDVVSLQLPNWYEALVVVHAAARIGAVINPIVPIYRQREVAFILGQARPRVVFVAHRFRGFDHLALALALELTSGQEDPAHVVVVRPNGPIPPGVETFDGLLAGAVDSEPTGAAGDIALLLYTSGTTADPKGVLHSHETLGYEVRTFVDLFDLGADDSVFMPSPITHITGLLFGVIMPVVTGCAVTLLDVWDPVIAVEAIERDRARFVMSATPFLHGLVTEYRRRGETSALQVFLCGGADVPSELVRQATDVMDAHVARVYGSSEFPTLCCGGPADDLGVRADTDGGPIGPVTYRLDHQVTGTTSAGELLVDGPERFLGYLDPELNVAAFTTDGMFRTGDLAVIDAAGAITLTGRSKDIIVRGGEKISAREVEDLLLGHPAVEAVAVVAMPDPQLVERVCAFVVPADPRVLPSVESLGAYLSERGLARPKHPERVEITDALPLTAAGKVQKAVLRELVRNNRLEFDPPLPTTHLPMESR